VAKPPRRGRRNRPRTGRRIRTHAGPRSRGGAADSAYRSAETEAGLKARGFRSRIHIRATRNHPLSQRQEEANRKRSRIRARIEHVFGAQETSAGSRLVRTVGIRQSASEDWTAEPRVQYPPSRDVREYGCGVTASPRGPETERSADMLDKRRSQIPKSICRPPARTIIMQKSTHCSRCATD
jgi:hypothetical protein